MKQINGINGIEKGFIMQNESLYNTTSSAIKELIDNSADAKAKTIFIISEPGIFSIEDDGVGFSEEKLEEFSKNLVVKSSIEDMDNKERRIGKFGAGAHEALMKLASLTQESPITIESNGKKYSSTINKKEGVLFANPTITTFTDQSKGTKCTIYNPRPIDNEQLEETIKNTCAQYPYKKDIRIILNQKEIPLYDKCYLKELGNDANTPGRYNKEGFLTFLVGEEITLPSGKCVRPIGVYVNTDAPEFRNDPYRNGNDGPGQKNSGVYLGYADNYIAYGDNLIYHLRNITSNVGGSGRKRFYLDCTHIPNEVGITVNKIREIPALYGNPEMKPVVDAFMDINTQLSKIHRERNRVANDENQEEHLRDYSVEGNNLLDDTNVNPHTFHGITAIEYAKVESERNFKDLVLDTTVDMENGIFRLSVNNNLIPCDFGNLLGNIQSKVAEYFVRKDDKFFNNHYKEVIVLQYLINQGYVTLNEI